MTPREARAAGNEFAASVGPKAECDYYIWGGAFWAEKLPVGCRLAQPGITTVEGRGETFAEALDALRTKWAEVSIVERAAAIARARATLAELEVRS